MSLLRMGHEHGPGHGHGHGPGHGHGHRHGEGHGHRHLAWTWTSEFHEIMYCDDLNIILNFRIITKLTRNEKHF